MRVFIDPGHGGPDVGAVGPTGLREADVVLDVAKRLVSLLLAGTSLLTRSGDVAVGLAERAAMANQRKADLFLSVHCNAAANRETQGIEAWYHGGAERGKRLASCLYEALIQEFPQAMRRGVKSDLSRYRTGFAVLRETAMPAALVELEFISHPEREAEMRTEEWRNRCARALAAGTRQYVKETTPPAPPLKPWDHPIDFRAGR
ncbi:MAG TPA: N-acetylmuramoyl-L-alanine amidase [Firmicutes bacterium]|nr:N-acetylmuramoyl-L-alanine amidase [Bacillota bacterium]